MFKVQLVINKRRRPIRSHEMLFIPKIKILNNERKQKQSSPKAILFANTNIFLG